MGVVEGVWIGLGLALFAGLAISSVLEARRAKRDARAARKQCDRLAAAIRSLVNDVKELARSAQVGRPGIASEAEAIVAAAMAHAAGETPPPEHGPAPVAYDRLTLDEEWALEWESAGRPETMVTDQGPVEFSREDMKRNAELVKSAKAKRSAVGSDTE